MTNLTTPIYWMFKNDIICTSTGEKTGRCVTRAYGCEFNGQRALIIRRILVKNAQPEEQYDRVWKAMGIKVEHYAFRFDSIFWFAMVANEAGLELDKLKNKEK